MTRNDASAPMHAWLAAALVALSGCVGGTPSGPSGKLAIDVAPLSLVGVSDVTYRLTVTTGAGPTAATVWQETITSSRFGDGRGSATYVGPCDASANPNHVALEILEVREPTRVLVADTDFVNPAPLGRPVVVDATCAENRDVAVRFDLTVLRRANQGFFDIAVEFDDIFCSAKLDCADAAGLPLDLLFDPVSGARIPSAVIGFACTGGAAAATHLWIDRAELTCGSTVVQLPVDRDAPGNVYSVNPDGPLRQVATYRGRESLLDAGGQSFAKLYANAAFALDALPAGTTCALHALATASDGRWTDRTSPSGVYPAIAWDVPLLANASGLVCGQMKLDDPLAAPGTGVHTAYLEATHTFDFGLVKDPGNAQRLVVIRGATYCGDGQCDADESVASCPGDCIATCPDGTWGAACDQACAQGDCVGTVVCARTTGVALGCAACVAGAWGAACESECSADDCTGLVTCDQATGAAVACEGCVAGLSGTTCNSPCPEGNCTGIVTCDQAGVTLSCEGCMAGFTGTTCAATCAEGNCTGVVTCDQAGVTLSCESCQSGYAGPTCEAPCTQGNCTGTVTCDQATGSASACEGCLPGFTGATCDATCAQGNCTGTVTCDQAGVALSCEGCEAGFTGPTCDATCAQGNCTGTVTCDQATGGATSCDACEAGFTGATCEATCAQGNCLGTVTCDQTTGNATSCDACAPGFTGATCDATCAQGNCTGTVTCDQTTGSATSCGACAAGFAGPTCNTPCALGNCATVVSCEQSTAAPLTCSGCQAGFWGPACASSCTLAHCAGTVTCDQATGAASACSLCAPGWSGTLCDSDWWNDAWQARAPLDVSTVTTQVSGADHVQVPVEVDRLCYGAPLPNVLYSYHFAEGSGGYVESRDGHAGFAALTNGGTFAPGIEGTGLSLSGPGQHVDLPDIVPTNHTLSMALWFKASALPSNNPALLSAWGTQGQSGGEVYVMYAANSSQCSVATPAGVRIMGKVHPMNTNEHNKCSTTAIQANQWYFVVLTYNSRFERLYVDGNQEVFHDYGAVGTLETSSAVRLGVARDLVTSFGGTLDDVVLFDGVLDDTDVDALMSPRCRRDLADLRFYDATAGTLLPHWVESDRKAWVRVPTASLGHTLHAYFDNPTASDASNGRATFDAFEDFSGPLSSSTWSLTAGCGNTIVPTVVNGKLRAVTRCGILSSVAGFDGLRRTAAVDVHRAGSEILTCDDARLGWGSVNLFAQLILGSPDDAVGFGAATGCGDNIGGVADFDLGTLSFNQTSTNSNYTSTWTSVMNHSNSQGGVGSNNTKGALQLIVSGHSATPRYYDNLRSGIPYAGTPALGLPCERLGTCAQYRWVDLGAQTQPMNVATCTGGGGSGADCNATNLGRRVHIGPASPKPTVYHRAVADLGVAGSMPGGVGSAYTLSGGDARLDWTGQASACTGQTTQLVNLSHVFECQQVH